MTSFDRLRRLAFRGAISLLIVSTSAQGMNPGDLLSLKRLTKELRLSPVQQDSASAAIVKIRQVVETFEWDYAKLTCEAAVWRGDRPPLALLKERKKKAYDDAEALIRGLGTGLDKGQQGRLNDLIKVIDGLLDLRLNENIPFYYVDTRPLFTKLENEREVNYTTFSETPEADSTASYASLLRTWTTRTYLGSGPIAEDPGQVPGVAEIPDLTVRTLSGPGQVKGKIVHSPLVVAATLMSPELVDAEILHLNTYFNPEGTSLDSLRTQYRSQNRVGETILIRLKMTTPNASQFLSLKNWTIYLEDNNGTGFEPVELRTEVVRPIEAIKLEIPGRTLEVQDVFGNYYPFIPGEKTYLTEKAEHVTFVGNEALVKAFFPLKSLSGSPVVTPEITRLKLIVKPADDGSSAYPAQVVWKFRRSRRP